MSVFFWGTGTNNTGPPSLVCWLAAVSVVVEVWHSGVVTKARVFVDM